MKRLSWEMRFGLSLIILSAILYGLHYTIFKDTRHISLWSLTSLAFLPISVLFVTLIINRLLKVKEKRTILEKLNMVIGVFFSEVGTELLIYFSNFNPKIDILRKDFIVSDDWSDQEFSIVSKRLKHYDYDVEIKKVNLAHLRSFLVEKRDFLLRLLENPILLEHEFFTKLLRAVFHLAEELESRKDIKKLPDTDHVHLAGDIKRAYILLVHEWLDYMKHLKNNYPYLFSLAMRTNPFDQNASPIVT